MADSSVPPLEASAAPTTSGGAERGFSLISRPTPRLRPRAMLGLRSVFAPEPEPLVLARHLLLWRWLAAAGQVGALTVGWLLGFQIPVLHCVMAVLALVWFNLIAMVVLPPNARLSERGALGWLLFDAAQLALLLGFTGGFDNPFCLLFVAPSVVAAAVLTQRATLVAGMVSLALSVALYLWAWPLRRADGLTILQIPELHRAGVAAALAIGVVFVAVHVRRLTGEEQRMSSALAATEAALAREQKLAAIGTLAAAAGHELGSPLAAIAMAAKEMERDLKAQPDQAEEAAFIRAQVERCRGILAKLATARADAEGHFDVISLRALLEEAAGPVTPRDRRLEIMGGAASLPVERRPAILHALRNFLQNAMDFSESRVRVEAALDGGKVLRLRICDDGPGFSPEALARLGEPYASTRAREAGGSPREGYEGMGLGVFIAKTLLERGGARVRFANARPNRSARPARPEEGEPLEGAVVEILWPADRLLAQSVFAEDPAAA
ncbi:ActS/PrrB/RegB family redox-sensitive histidine kinase [Neomegalonema perideroedes]|uniref:ActS/PrrB/RegB family redox-sensitive histidine kinase n=1 Tax=Neomegalonema perideroedes TaxID=217219 RepID=UPI0003A42A5A|nr:ActS/PrrB/RegB family redox-sensitive histidine kinase [Neomegalonema perideroedes]